MAAGGTAGPLIATQIFPPAWVGIPVALLVAGSAAAAPLMGWLGHRHGRRRALSVGYLIGAVGAVAVVAGTTVAAPLAFLVGSFLLGGGNAAIFLSRYADYGNRHRKGPDSRPTGIRRVLAATSVGAVASPLLIGPLDALGAVVGLTSYSGAYACTFLVYALAAAMTWRAAGADRSLAPPDAVRSRPRPHQASLRGGLLALGAVNLLMVGVMTVAPVHLADHGVTPAAVGAVVAVHVAAMFAPAPVSGWLVDRIGPTRGIAAGLTMMSAAGVVALLLDRDHGLTATPGLVLLGLGWNLGIVSGSVLLATSAIDPRGEAHGEISMGIGAAAGSTAAGVTTGTFDLAVVWLAASAISAATAVAALAEKFRILRRRG